MSLKLSLLDALERIERPLGSRASAERPSEVKAIAAARSCLEDVLRSLVPEDATDAERDGVVERLVAMLEAMGSRDARRSEWALVPGTLSRVRNRWEKDADAEGYLRRLLSKHLRAMRATDSSTTDDQLLADEARRRAAEALNPAQVEALTRLENRETAIIDVMVTAREKGQFITRRTACDRVRQMEAEENRKPSESVNDRDTFLKIRTRLQKQESRAREAVVRTLYEYAAAYTAHVERHGESAADTVVERTLDALRRSDPYVGGLLLPQNALDVALNDVEALYYV